MKLTFYTLAFSILIFSACQSPENKSSDTSNQTTAVKDIEQMTLHKNSIDTLFKNSYERLMIFAKVSDSDTPLAIMNADFPENVEVSFNILKDSLGKIVATFESPSSESGDWNIVYTHYFDSEGKTFAFERQTYFYNSMCTEGLAHEIITNFYNNDFSVLDKKYQLTDEYGKNLHKDSCQFPYDYSYEISENSEDYLSANRILIPH